MVPKKVTATFQQIVARLKAVHGLEGAAVGDHRWEGGSDTQLAVLVERKSGFVGFSIRWEYHNGRELHQHGCHSVSPKELEAVATQIADHLTKTVPARFVEEVEQRVATERDPLLATARAPQAWNDRFEGENENSEPDRTEAEPAPRTEESLPETPADPVDPLLAARPDAVTDAATDDFSDEGDTHDDPDVDPESDQG